LNDPKLDALFAKITKDFAIIKWMMAILIIGVYSLVIKSFF